jgi:glycosyltransferase involved in cell wall biosynthesis
MLESIEVVIPVYNEEKVLSKSVEKLIKFLKVELGNPWRILIADNASTDGTRVVGERLCREHPEVRYFYLREKGRGRALRAAWLASDADIVSYMDVDLSTDPDHLVELVHALKSGYHIAVGSRLSKGSQVTRSFKREFISRSYNLMIKGLFFTSFPDAQCGFKALTRQAAQTIIPHVQNNNWFFDTELLIISAKGGYSIKSVPVKWVDDPDSTVNVLRTATEDITGLLRLRFGGVPVVPSPEHLK